VQTRRSLSNSLTATRAAEEAGSASEPVLHLLGVGVAKQSVALNASGVPVPLARQEYHPAAVDPLTNRIYALYDTASDERTGPLDGRADPVHSGSPDALILAGFGHLPLCAEDQATTEECVPGGDASQGAWATEVLLQVRSTFSAGCAASPRRQRLSPAQQAGLAWSVYSTQGCARAAMTHREPAAAPCHIRARESAAGGGGNIPPVSQTRAARTGL
jgi:hypothetical protein